MFQNSSLNSVFLRRFITACIAVIAVSIGFVAYNMAGVGVALATGFLVFCLLYLGYKQQLLTRAIAEIFVLLNQPDEQEGDLLKRFDLIARNIEQLNASAQLGEKERFSELSTRIRNLERDYEELVRRIAKSGGGSSKVVDDDHKIIPLRQPQIPSEADIPVPAAQATPVGEPRFRINPPELINPNTSGQTASPGIEKNEEPGRDLNLLAEKELSQMFSAGQLELNLQPVMDLQKREPVYYQAMYCDQGNNGELIDTSQLPETQIGAGLAQTVDNRLISDAVRMLRALDNLDRRTGLFCKISKNSLRDFDNILALLKTNHIYADSVVVEISQSDWNGLDGPQREKISTAAELGFSLCLGNCTDLALDALLLQSSGFRYLKLSAITLLEFGPNNTAENSIGVFVDEMQTVGLTVIGSDINYEYQLLDLIDFGLILGIGVHFAPPRPVKSELLDPSRKVAG